MSEKLNLTTFMLVSYLKELKVTGYGISKAYDPLTFLMRFQSWSRYAARGDTGWTTKRRVVFWVWCFIRKATYKDIGLNSHVKDEAVFYAEQELPEYPDSNGERLTAIHDFFKALSENYGLEMTKCFAQRMELEWAKIYDNINTLSKFSRTHSDSKWTWEYLKKKRYFVNSGLLDITPSSHHERVHFINGVFDLGVIEDDFEFDLKCKDDIFAKLENAFYKMRSRKMGGDKEKEKINVAVNPEIKRMLEEISRLQGRNYTVIIESLIKEKYSMVKPLNKDRW